MYAEYAQVTRMLGNGRLEAFCFDGVNRLCHIRGKLRKRVWIGVGDIILLGLREFQDQKVNVVVLQRHALRTATMARTHCLSSRKHARRGPFPQWVHFRNRFVSPLPTPPLE